MSCCRETGCRRQKPVLVRRGGLTGRWFVVTDYTDLGGGIVSSRRRHDVTEDLEAYLKAEGWTPPPDAP